MNHLESRSKEFLELFEVFIFCHSNLMRILHHLKMNSSHLNISYWNVVYDGWVLIVAQQYTPMFIDDQQQ